MSAKDPLNFRRQPWRGRYKYFRIGGAKDHVLRVHPHAFCFRRSISKGDPTYLVVSGKPHIIGSGFSAAAAWDKALVNILAEVLVNEPAEKG
jgi:hypothetical protein